MQQTTIETFVQDPKRFVRAAQKERVLITKAGAPLAVVVGVRFKDDEDLSYEASPKFWKMIRQSRSEPTRRLDDVKKELGLEKRAKAGRKRRKS